MVTFVRLLKANLRFILLRSAILFVGMVFRRLISLLRLLKFDRMVSLRLCVLMIVLWLLTLFVRLRVRLMPNGALGILRVLRRLDLLTIVRRNGLGFMLFRALLFRLRLVLLKFIFVIFGLFLFANLIVLMLLILLVVLVLRGNVLRLLMISRLLLLFVVLSFCFRLRLFSLLLFYGDVFVRLFRHVF